MIIAVPEEPEERVLKIYSRGGGALLKKYVRRKDVGKVYGNGGEP